MLETTTKSDAIEKDSLSTSLVTVFGASYSKNSTLSASLLVLIYLTLSIGYIENRKVSSLFDTFCLELFIFP